MKIMLQELEEDVDMEEDLTNMIEIGKMKKHMEAEVLPKTLKALPMLLVMLLRSSSREGAPKGEVVALTVVTEEVVETQITEVKIIEEAEVEVVGVPELMLELL